LPRRPARSGLLAALEMAGEGDTLTVWRIVDRLGRSTLYLLQILEDLHRNITFQSIMDGIDTNTAAGRMVFDVSAMAEFERSVISERTKRAWRRRGGAAGMWAVRQNSTLNSLIMPGA
jgi:DNA invertase Pin-like site-specific DNA recombinase